MATDAELNALKQGYETNLRQLQALLDAQARLRAVAERTAQETRGELERLAEALCPGFVDRAGKDSPLGLAQVTAREMADAVIRDVQVKLSRLGAAEVAGRSASRKHDDAAAENERLQGEVMRLEQELAEMRQKHKQATLRISVLEQSTADTCHSSRNTQGAPAPALPEWIREWQDEPSHTQDLALLAVIAETGIARQADAVEMVGGQTDGGRESRDVAQVFERCARKGLIESIGVEDFGHLVRLTETGQDVCRVLLDREPVASRATEFLSRHGSPERALLVLVAADLLRDAGYDVDPLPNPLELPGGRRFTPDLAASLHGRTQFVAVEQDTRRGGDDRDEQWCSYYDANGGHFYVVVPNRQVLDGIRGEIMFWGGQRDWTIWMTSINDDRGKRGDDVWSLKRERTEQP